MSIDFFSLLILRIEHRQKKPNVSSDKNRDRETWSGSPAASFTQEDPTINSMKRRFQWNRSRRFGNNYIPTGFKWNCNDYIHKYVQEENYFGSRFVAIFSYLSHFFLLCLCVGDVNIWCLIIVTVNSIWNYNKKITQIIIYKFHKKKRLFNAV